MEETYPGVFSLTWKEPKEWICDQQIGCYIVSANSSRTGKLIFIDSTTRTHYTTSCLPEDDHYVFFVTPVAADSCSEATIYGETV